MYDCKKKKAAKIVEESANKENKVYDQLYVRKSAMLLGEGSFSDVFRVDSLTMPKK